MTFGKSVRGLREQAEMSWEQLAEALGCSEQTVRQWEDGDAFPAPEELTCLARFFGVSLKRLFFADEELSRAERVRPNYESLPGYEYYPASLMTEYLQSTEEGLDIEGYRELFETVSNMPRGEAQKELGDLLFGIVSAAPAREGYPYVEPSDLESIRQLRKACPYGKGPVSDLEEKISGAWYGRICGCLLGKTVEGVRTHELIPFLKETGNYPMTRYILKSDLDKTDLSKYEFGFGGRCYADSIDGMPVDDDTNYTVLYQEIIERYGRDFTPSHVARIWLLLQPKEFYFTAERVAYRNFLYGFVPPDSAFFENPYREWIGAQIRADYFGYICPGDPEQAAAMAWRDASVSHTKNGIYGEMMAAAMIASAARTSDLEEILQAGLAEIPATSRLYEDVWSVLKGYREGVSREACFESIHRKFDEKTSHGWCHVIPNAMIVAASLLYGGGAYGASVCMAVQTGFDTDCNGATVGSILGMANGIRSIPEVWTNPISDTLYTSLYGLGTVRISDRIAMTLRHIRAGAGEP